MATRKFVVNNLQDFVQSSPSSSNSYRVSRMFEGVNMRLSLQWKHGGHSKVALTINTTADWGMGTSREPVTS